MGCYHVLFQINENVYSFHLHQNHRGIVRTDSNLCSSKDCMDKRQVALQNGFETLCQHHSMVQSEEPQEVSKSWSVAECQVLLNEFKFGEELSSAVSEYLAECAGDQSIGKYLIVTF